MSRLLIQCLHLFKSYSSIVLFDDISLSINEGDIFALIGENGSGKTTLLQIVRENVIPDSGKLYKASLLTIGYLPQVVHCDDFEITAREYLNEGPCSNIERQMSQCIQDPERLQEWESLHEQYEKLGGYRRIPLEQIVHGLKIQIPLLDMKMQELSSGQRTRIALAKALVDNPDLLLLDEPTNHLDQEMQSFLQKTLISRKGATVIVSHDRRFLNQTCNHLIELESGKLTCYTGNYDSFLQKKEKLIEKQMKEYSDQQQERTALKQKIKETTFSKKNPKLPTDRNFMAYDRRGEYHQKSIKHNLDALKSRLDEIEAHPLLHPCPKSIKGLYFSHKPLATAIAIECDRIRKAFGDKILFSEFSKTLKKNDRIILCGPNGCGKTTMLQCIAGIVPLDSGIIRKNPSVKIAYLDQEVDRIPKTLTPLRYFEDTFHLTEQELRRQLHMAALGGVELLNRPFSTLSTGQRKRIMLLSLVLEKPNVLLLDEPTNHLDLLTLEAFEKALLTFEGTILAVSHDQTFIDKIATEIWQL